MSIVKRFKSKRKGGYRVPRRRQEKILHKKRMKTKIFKSRGWKINYPEHFQVINEFPYIIRK